MTVELPKDAEGREIPLDTALLYGEVSGDEYEVVCFNFSPSMRRWRVKLKRRDDVGIYATDVFTLSQPDSWEKLEEDLSGISKGSACHYFHKGVSNTCEGCPAAGTGSCWPTMARDIKSRIRKLRGDD